MSVITVTKNNFNEIKAQSNEKTVLLDFYADWCGPCRMVAPIVHEIADEREDIIVGKINVDDEPELAKSFNVTSIPMVAFVKNNTFADLSIGLVPKDQLKGLIEANK